MEHYAVRVWLPDRPGALGQVASRIGAVRGDVVGIEILERGAGRAIDELIVALPEPGLVDLLVNEIAQVDGRRCRGRAIDHDPTRDALARRARDCGAARRSAGRRRSVRVLCADAIVDFDADWGVVLRPSDSTLIHAVGSPPEAAWLVAFIEGSKVSEAVAAGHAGPDDVAWAPLPDAGHGSCSAARGGRSGPASGGSSAALARIADHRWTALG